MPEIKNSAPSTVPDGLADRRRTQRVNIAMPVLVRGDVGGKKFEEETTTVSVNAHGCLIRLGTRVARSQAVSIVNPKTAEELPCTVTSLGQKDGNKLQVGIQFDEPSPLFWRIAFPPVDWDPSERKRSGARGPSDPTRAQR